MKLEEAKKLKYGQIIYSKNFRNADGSPQRFKVNGNIKTWKKDKNRIRVPLKRGLYEFGYLDEYNISQFKI
jgi:hypothetical protein